eukprot:6177440-Pleurochrysis_carterae.AAC.1
MLTSSLHILAGVCPPRRTARAALSATAAKTRDERERRVPGPPNIAQTRQQACRAARTRQKPPIGKGRKLWASITTVCHLTFCRRLVRMDRYGMPSVEAIRFVKTTEEFLSLFKMLPLLPLFTGAGITTAEQLCLLTPTALDAIEAQHGDHRATS